MALNGYSSPEQLSLIAELLHGWDLAKQLKAEMGPQVSGQIKGTILDGILSSYENSLCLLKCGGLKEQSQQHVVTSTNIPESPLSVIGSPKSEDLNPTQQDSKDFSKKRKMVCNWTKQAKVRDENGADGPPDDGHSWRKYGQKDILGAKHPRSYYRCTYRNIQGCCAIKQVQRSDEDPLVFDITYKGRHTCTMTSRSKSAPTSPEKRQVKKQPDFPTIVYQQEQLNEMLNFQTGLNIDIHNLENPEIGLPFSTRESGYDNHPFLQSTPIDNSFHSSLPLSFVLSPATTSESTYFSTSPCKISTFGGGPSGQNAESDIADIISATTSRTNSPIITTDFPLDQLEFNTGWFAM